MERRTGVSPLGWGAVEATGPKSEPGITVGEPVSKKPRMNVAISAAAATSAKGSKSLEYMRENDTIIT